MSSRLSLHGFISFGNNLKKRILHILNWDKYQARSDKELPWLKLWGRLFKTPWFQIMQDEEKFVTIALLDLARQFNNNLPEDLIFKGYLRGNYGIFISQERIFKLCKYLVDNDFLSDNCPTFVEVEGDIDKIREDKDIASPKKQANPDIKIFLDYYSTNYKQVFNVLPIINWGKDSAIVKSLLAVYERPALESYLLEFLKSKDDFVLKAGFSLNIFKTQVTKIASKGTIKQRLELKGFMKT